MGRNAPRGHLKSSPQAAASDGQTQNKLHARPDAGRSHGRARLQGSPRANGPTSLSHAAESTSDSSSLSPEELTLHEECVKLTEERLPLGIAYPRFLEVVRRVVPFDHGTLYLAEGPAGALIPVALKGNRVDLADQVRFARGPGLSAWVAQEGRPVIIPHPMHASDAQPFADKGLRAFAAIPMRHQRWVTGVLALTRAEQVFVMREFDHLVRSSERLAATLSRLQLQAQYRAWTHTDPETGLSAWHHFVARLDAELDRARHQSGEFSVVVVAFDGHERVSPSGRAQEKPLVRLVGERLQSSTRSCDMVALLDAGVFGVLLAGVNGQTAGTIIRRIVTTVIREITELAPPARGVRVSGGVAAFSDDATSAEELVARARSRLQQIA